MTSKPSAVFKIFTDSEWSAFTAAETFEGSADDLRDGFIHLSTHEQVKGTLEKHFAGQQGLVIAEIETASLGGALQFEASSNGQLFPHLYRALNLSEVLSQSSAAAW